MQKKYTANELLEKYLNSETKSDVLSSMEECVQKFTGHKKVSCTCRDGRLLIEAVIFDDIIGDSYNTTLTDFNLLDMQMLYGKLQHTGLTLFEIALKKELLMSE